MMLMSRAQSLSARRGVSLIEALMAVGVILIGLVGIMSLLPLGGRFASDTVSLNRGSTLVANAYARLHSRGLLRPAGWLQLADHAATATAAVGLPQDEWMSTSVCIDPLYLANPQNRIPESAGGYYTRYVALGTNGYRRNRFPFYKEIHNPLMDPSERTTASNRWPAMPRMVRVSGSRETGSSRSVWAGTEAMLTAQDNDELVFQLTDDTTLEPALFAAGTAVGQRPDDQADIAGHYSWIATVNPLPGTKFASLAVVVYRNRQRGFLTRRNRDGVAQGPDGNAKAERLAWVISATGFDGGAGGAVVIAAAANTSSDIRSGGWVMLSRNVSGSGPFFRWYRIRATLGEPVIAELEDPIHGTERSVWQRKLLLDGSDWSFVAGQPAGQTLVTLVDDVVSVTEYTIKLRS